MGSGVGDLGSGVGGDFGLVGWLRWDPSFSEPVSNSKTVFVAAGFCLG